MFKTNRINKNVQICNPSSGTRAWELTVFNLSSLWLWHTPILLLYLTPILLYCRLSQFFYRNLTQFFYCNLSQFSYIVVYPNSSIVAYPNLSIVSYPISIVAYPISIVTTPFLSWFPPILSWLTQIYRWYPSDLSKFFYRGLLQPSYRGIPQSIITACPSCSPTEPRHLHRSVRVTRAVRWLGKFKIFPV